MLPYGQGELGKIKTRDGFEYPITWEDLLWAGRMLMGESGREATGVHGAAVLWSMAQFFVSMKPIYRTYTSAIQAYSQPINPIWRRDGQKCRPGGPFHGTKFCSAEKLDRRDRISTATWESFGDNLQKFLIDWARGTIANPIDKANEFAAPKVAKQKGDRLEFVWDSLGRADVRGVPQEEERGNAFYLTKGTQQRRVTKNWPNHFVYIEYKNVRSGVTTPQSFPPQAGTAQPTQANASAAQQEISERISQMTHGRTTSPGVRFDYTILGTGSVESYDSNADSLISENNTSVRDPYEKFYEQILALKEVTNVELAQSVPMLEISIVDERGNIINLNKEIFSQPTLHNLLNEEVVPESFPERPLASLETFTVTVQTIANGGPTGIVVGNLTIKVHNPDIINEYHPKGKYLHYMMRQGYYLRVKYGVETMNEDARAALRWIEDDFFISSHQISINDDKTATITMTILPAAFKLFNQIMIGEHIPVDLITDQDVDLAIRSAIEPDTPVEQIAELKSNFLAFKAEFNSRVTSQGVRRNEFGSILHGALEQSQVLSNPGLPRVHVENFIEGLKTIQSALLTRRYEELLSQTAYVYTNKGVPIIAVNCGPLFHQLIMPEVNAIAEFVARNGRIIGSVDSTTADSPDGYRRRNKVKLIFGNFNPHAGAWANKPISTFPVNIEGVFSHLRSEREVGKFSDSLNNFISYISNTIDELEYYVPEMVSEGSTAIPRIEVPSIKYSFYPDPNDDSSWVFYVYDNKMFQVRFLQLKGEINDRATRQTPLTKEEIIQKLQQLRIPWIEIGELGSIIRTMSAESKGDDMVMSHLMYQANSQALNQRRVDASQLPAGISREFFAGRQLNPQDIIRSTNIIMPLRVSLTSMVMVSSAVLFAPIYIFFPIDMFSALYVLYDIGHEVSSGTSNTKMSLQIETTQANLNAG